MLLDKFTVSNYRSIDVAAKNVVLGNYTVLVGKNNEGKSNLLKALNLAISTMQQIAFKRPQRGDSEWSLPRIYRNQGYSEFDFDLDFPKSKSKSKRQYTTIRLHFTLSEEEIVNFKEKTELNINSELVIEFVFTKLSTVRVLVHKKGGKNWNRSIQKILQFVTERIGFNYIPAVRTEENFMNIIREEIYDAFNDLEKDSKYKEYEEKLNELETKRVNQISNKLRSSLVEWLPDTEDVRVELENSRRRNIMRGLNIYMKSADTDTLLQNKGDGVQSLFALALLAQNKGKEKADILAIDEPEAHLHPEAIRRLQNTISKMSKYSQVIIATHNPILVNRNRVDSNIIIDNGSVKKAKNIREIRETLGVSVEDNLINASKVWFVEGVSDKKFFNTIGMLIGSPALKRALRMNDLVIQPMHGVTKMENSIRQYQSMITKFFFVLDNDESAKASVKKATYSGLLTPALFSYIPKPQYMNESELEDFYDERFIGSVCKNVLHIDISEALLKSNRKRKWSQKMDSIFSENGNDWASQSESVKIELAEAIVKADAPLDCLSEDGKKYVQTVITKIENFFNLV